MAEIQMPKGALARERWEKIIKRIEKLERRVALLEGGETAERDGEQPTKESLVARAAELGIGPESTLSRWGTKRLESEIAEAEADDNDDEAGG
ncbi:MAG: hypothetical protein ACOCZ9_02490 [Spirochaetota bacterium]